MINENTKDKNEQLASRDLFACTFCGEKPTPSGRMFSRDRKEIVNQVTHPTTGKCPLDMLVFREGDWQTRFEVNTNNPRCESGEA